MTTDTTPILAMTDDELDAAVAVEAMGWEVVGQE